MKKKTKRNWLILLWLLVGAAFLALLLTPPKRPMPKAVWRVPVQVQPDLSKMKTIPFSELLPFEEKKEEAKPEIREGELPPVAEPTMPPLTPLPRGEGSLIAIIIDDVGLLPAASRRATRLPASVSLSFLPYAPELQEQVEAARQGGHEVLLHMPMEPIGRQNPGPDALMTNLSDEDLQKRIQSNLNKFEGYVGVNNHMGSRFTLDRRRMEIFIQALHEGGLFFVDSRTGARSVGEEVARQAGIRTAARDVFLDDTVSEASIMAEIRRLERLSREKGSAIAIGHPHAATLKVLEEWIPQAESRGFRIVPVGQLVR